MEFRKIWGKLPRTTKFVVVTSTVFYAQLLVRLIAQLVLNVLIG